ncbi:MAG TPA: glycosyltransferase family 4 protein, partial [Kiloniellaceae bacterium]|nr:glycosyltransferase family 4 protein [Kiloniellaceae bacterium]
MAEILARRGHQVDVFTYHLGRGVTSPGFSIYRIPPVPSYNKEDPGPSYRKLFHLDPLLARMILRDTRGAGYDVIHAHHFEGLIAALPSAWRHKLPVVFDVHTLLESELPSYPMGLPQGFKQAAGRLLDTWFPKRSDHVICVSDEIRAGLLKKTRLSADRFSTIPNGVEDLFFSSDRQKPKKLNGQPPQLVYAGNLATYQRIDLLLEAFAEARRSRPDLRLQILTDTAFDRYEARAAALGVREQIDISNPGFDQLPRLLAEATVVANPRIECAGLPQKLVNYMAAGCPIVSFSGSARHIRNGDSGLIVDDGDVSAFSTAILRLLSDRDLALALGNNA